MRPISALIVIWLCSCRSMVDGKGFDRFGDAQDEKRKSIPVEKFIQFGGEIERSISSGGGVEQRKRKTGKSPERARARRVSFFVTRRCECRQSCSAPHGTYSS